MGRLINNFSSGIGKDFHERNIPADSYIDALNMVEGTTRNKMAGLSLEPGNEDYIDLGKDVYVVGFEYDEGRDWLYIFLKRGDVSEIGYIAKGFYTKIVDDKEYECEWGFSECERIKVEIKYFNNCEEPHLYWTNAGVTKVINVTEMLHEERRKGRICDDFILLRGAPDPFIRTQILDVGGASAEAGLYQFFVQLEDDSGNKTNWSHGSEVVRVGSENNIPGELSKHAVQITVHPLDNRYDFVNLAVRKIINGIPFLQQIYSGQYSDNGFTYVYYGKTGREITLTDEEVLQKKDYVFHNYEIHQSNGVLYFYQIPTPKVLDYQFKANQVELYPVFFAVRLEDAHKYSQLARDENYLPFIRWNYDDGTTSYWFPCTGQDHIEFDECGDYPWIKGNDAVVPHGIIPRFKSVFGGNGGGSVGGNGNDITIRTGGGCSGGTCGLAGDDQELVKQAFRSIPDAMYPDADPGSNSEQYLQETYNEVKNEKFPNGFNNPNKDGEIIFSGNLFDGQGNFLNPRGADATPSADDADQVKGYNLGEHKHEEIEYKDIDDNEPDCEGGNCLDCDPCDEPAVAELKNNPTTKAAQELARSCCPECSDETIAAVKTIKQAIDLCQEKKTIRQGKRNDIVGLKNVDENVDGSTNPGGQTLAPRNTEEKGDCFSVSISGNVVDQEGIGQPATFSITVIQCVDGKYYTNDIDLENPDGEYVSGNSISELVNLYEDTFNDIADGREILTVSKHTSSPTECGELSCDEFEIEEEEEIDVVFPDHTPDIDIHMEPIYAEDGCTIIGYKPYKLGEGEFGKAYTIYKYPEKKDCSGRFVFRDAAGKNIRLFKTPSSKDCPTSFGGYGVVDKYNLDNTIGGESYAVLIGLGAKKIQYPTQAELPLGKKLNEHKPFEFGFAKRDQFNETKIAEGIAINTFEGYVYGQRRSYFRHGVNGVEKVDRHVAGPLVTVNGGVQLPDRRGIQAMSSRPIYGFFSPDTMYNSPPLFSDYIALYDQLKGAGTRHGLYERGPEIDDNKVGRRNQKCSRSSIFLSTSQLMGSTYPGHPYYDPIDIKGIDYVKADSKTNIPMMAPTMIPTRPPPNAPTII